MCKSWNVAIEYHGPPGTYFFSSYKSKATAPIKIAVNNFKGYMTLNKTDIIVFSLSSLFNEF